MSYAVHEYLIDMHHAEMRAAADDHRFVTAARSAAPPAGGRAIRVLGTHLPTTLRRRWSIAEVKPCPP